MASDRPLLGVGMGNFRWHFREYAGVSQPVPHAHSAYFEWLSGTGFLGLLVFLWMVVELGRALLRRAAWGSMDTDGEVWQLALTMSLAAWLAHGFFEAFYGTTTYVVLVIILGLALRRRPSAPR
jgi:O-antigen ligase